MSCAVLWWQDFLCPAYLVNLCTQFARFMHEGCWMV